ncbi:hypothetical protein CEQ90_01005 [Lewinellaceae bacterium SD302]|nr:hypothetical protein CEQ90_01005 [Lewinellaceae bacterium SD302]
MLVQELQQHLRTKDQISFTLPDGKRVPAHYHVTEVGEINKRFIDCGGTLREETVVSLQLWSSFDYNHRLHPEKLSQIIDLSREKLNIGNHEIEVEYQGDTIGKYGLEVGPDGNFKLTTKTTACLALEECGIPVVATADKAIKGSCTPGGGCC